MDKVAVILAGGQGEEFWPMSRKSRPKQLLRIFSHNSMIRECFLRLNQLIPIEKIFVVTNREYYSLLVEELPELDPDNFILEPFARGTASAIALTAVTVEKRFPGTSTLICPSDHIIDDLLLFREVVQDAFAIVKQTACIVSIGLPPTRPETLYGYLEIGDTISKVGQSQAHEVKHFIEKPDYNTAVQLVASPDYVWNSGISIWDTQTMLEEFSKFMPELYSGMLEIADCIGFSNEDSVKSKIYSSLGSVSIDYGVMEKTKNLLCIKANLSWDDIGSWNSLFRILEVNEDHNILSGKVAAIDTKDSMVLGDSSTLIATVGVKDLIVVKIRDVILICNKYDDQKVLDLLNQLKLDNDLTEYL